MNIHFSNLIGKKIVAFRGFPHKRPYEKKITTNLEFILFDDGETILHLDEQNYYDYHDCSSSARHLSLENNRELWERMFNKLGWEEPEDQGLSPFN